VVLNIRSGQLPLANAASLDKYDPVLGYVPGNIMVICMRCNTKKQDQTGEELVQFGRAVIAALAAYVRPVSDQAA
jgi:hypothetical protein